MQSDHATCAFQDFKQTSLPDDLQEFLIFIMRKSFFGHFCCHLMKSSTDQRHCHGISRVRDELERVGDEMMARLKITEKSQVDMSLRRKSQVETSLRSAMPFAIKAALQLKYCMLQDLMQGTAYCKKQMHKC